MMSSPRKIIFHYSYKPRLYSTVLIKFTSVSCFYVDLLIISSSVYQLLTWCHYVFTETEESFGGQYFPKVWIPRDLPPLVLRLHHNYWPQHHIRYHRRHLFWTKRSQGTNNSDIWRGWGGGEKVVCQKHFIIILTLAPTACF